MDHVEQKKFIESLKINRDYWLSLPNKSPEEIVDGVLFSLLVMIDGDSGTNDFHPLEIVDTITGKRIDCGYLHELYRADEREHDLGKETLDKQMKSASEVQEQNRRKPDCALIGQDGNIFNLMGIASRTLREHGMADQAKEMTSRIHSDAKSYYEALNIIGEYVNITSDDKKRNHETVSREMSEL